MSNIGGVIIQNGVVSVGQTSADNITGFLMHSPVEFSGLEYGAAKDIYQPSDAEELGITAAADETNGTLLHRHISEFYRIAGKGVKLWLAIYPDTTHLGIAAALANDTAKNFLINASGEIKVLTVIDCSNNAVTSRFSKLLTALPNFKALRTWADENFITCSIILEGAGFNVNGTISDLRNLQVSGQTLRAEGASVFIGVDGDYRDVLIADPLPGRAQYADVASYAASIAAVKVNENPGECSAERNLFGATTDGTFWANPSLSIDDADNVPTKVQMQSKAQQLEDKGYVFGLVYQGYSGVYINNDHCVCPVLIDSDGSMNEFNISLSRTRDKAVRNLRAQLMPLVKSTVPVDTKTGKLPTAIIKTLEAEGNKVFEQLQRDGEVSGGATVIDPASDLITPPKRLLVSFALVPTGQIGEIKGTINIVKSL